MKKFSLIIAFCVVCMNLDAQRPRPTIDAPIPYMRLDQMSNQIRSDFLAEHYWEMANFPFHDTMTIHRTDVEGRRWLPTFFREYLQLIQFADLPVIQKSLADFIKKTDTNERMYRYFIELFDFYLNDALSDMREEQWIVPVWQQMLKSRWATFSDSAKLNFFLEMAAKNPVGSKATNLEYTTIQGQKGNMLDIDAELFIVFFYIPGCPQCSMTLDWITTNEDYQALINAGILQGFAFYPEKDMNAFRGYRNVIPSTWINARDPDGMSQLEEDGLYQMRGAPTIYLLDRNKNVILKDARLDLLFNEFHKARERFLN
jgi:hypothetical protein